MIFAIPLVVVVTTLAFPIAHQVPALDIRPSCQADMSLMDLNGKRGKLCLGDEASARDELEKQWSKFPVPDRHRCSAEAQLDDMPSYVDLLECLTLARDARLGPPD